MAAIDIGPDASDRPDAGPSGWTWVFTDNPANDTGTISTFEIWALTNLSDTKAGTFSGSGTSWDDRDYETLGSVTAGSKQTFSGLDCDVSTDDRAGIYFSGGTLEWNDSGEGGAHGNNSDRFGQGSATYGAYAGRAGSCYGSGTTAGWSNIAKINGTTATDYAKVPGSAAVADIGKVNGVSV